MAVRVADQAVRDRVRTDFDTTIVLEAGAGTGKTTALVSRLVQMVVSGASTLDRIVAITFTEAAAGELKMRLRDALERELLVHPDASTGQRLSRALVDLEGAHVSTIHAFAAALLRERPFEAGMDPGFEVIAEVAGERTFDDTWQEWLEKSLVEGDEVLVRAVHLGLKLGDLQQAARRMVAERDVLGQPVVGTSAFDPRSFLRQLEAALPALEKQKNRCLDEGDGALVAIEELEQDIRQAKRLAGPGLEQFLTRMSITYSKGTKKNWQPQDACTEVKEELRRLRGLLDEFRRDSDADVNAALRRRLCDFLEKYEARKREHALADFQDLLLQARDLVRDSIPARRYFQRKFDFILVDEFQDTDPLQAELVAFLGEDVNGPPAAAWRDVHLRPGKLFVVGDPKQSIYRFRRADLQVYEDVKSLMLRCGGEVLDLTTNFRSVGSIIRFVNDRFDVIFRNPGDPAPKRLHERRADIVAGETRVVALPVPPEQMPAETTVGPRRVAVANTIAAFIERITRDGSWRVHDAAAPGGPLLRTVRPGDIALLVRKMTPEFVGPFEDAFHAREITYRLVGGKEYFERDEVQALAAVLRAIDNPADRLALVQALRSSFFAVSDDDLVQFVASGGVLNINAPLGEDVARRELFDPIFTHLKRLHRLRRIEPPSAVIEALFIRTRALPAFLARPAGAQIVANLWKVLDSAREYERSGPATLRAFVRFLQDEEASGREEGDSLVGEAIGQSVEVITVHKAKGLEYPVVILADLLTGEPPPPGVIINHAAGQGWIKIGRFEPADWAQQKLWNATQEQAEGRRLLYVGVTRARDHLVIPCLPGTGLSSWLGQLANGLVDPGKEPAWGQKQRLPAALAVADGIKRTGAEFTVFDSRDPRFGVEAAPAPKASQPFDGPATHVASGRAAEQAWVDARRAARKAAKVAAELPSPPSMFDGVVTLPAAAGEDASGEERSSAERLFGVPPLDGEVEATEPAAAFDVSEPAQFGRYVHDILTVVDLSGKDLIPIAATLARRHGLTENDAERAATMVDRVLRLPLMAEARTSSRVLREVPTGPEGRADLVFETPVGWRVVEFKTNREDDAGHHGPQVLAYAARIAAATQRKAVASICQVRTATVTEIVAGA